MATEVLSALDLNKEPLNEKFILVKEMVGANANFVINCLISKQIKEKNGVVLIGTHYPYKHYQESGLNLGYNLNNSKDLFKCIDCLELIANHFKDSQNVEIDLVSENKSLNKLFEIVQRELDSMIETKKSVCLIVDDLLSLNEWGFSVEDINMFVQMCRGYAYEHEAVSIVLGTHVIPEDEESFALSGLMSHMSDIICEVATLKTGRSFDITGSMVIDRPLSDLMQQSNNLTKLNKYHYKLFERGVKVFAPGSK